MLERSVVFHHVQFTEFYIIPREREIRIWNVVLYGLGRSSVCCYAANYKFSMGTLEHRSYLYPNRVESTIDVHVSTALVPYEQQNYGFLGSVLWTRKRLIEFHLSL